MKSTTIAVLATRKGFQHLGKRLFDIVFSATILLVFSPLFLLIWVGIRFSSPGKIIFSQERLGVKGKPFRCFKFRTMHLGAEESLPLLLALNPQLRDEWKSHQKLQKDPRVFPVGRFLRKSSLDELPQFWNVLIGDMSIVGPRPYMTCQLGDLGPYAHQILSIRSGITGIWQTSGRSKKSFQERIQLDIQYLQRQSFWLDLLLIMRTIPAVIFSKDAC